MTPLEIGFAAGGLVVWLLVSPWKPCPLCGGSGRHGLSTRHAYGSCLRCSGRGRVPRIGARIVRRLILRREL